MKRTALISTALMLIAITSLYFVNTSDCLGKDMAKKHYKAWQCYHVPCKSGDAFLSISGPCGKRRGYVGGHYDVVAAFRDVAWHAFTRDGYVFVEILPGYNYSVISGECFKMKYDGDVWR